MNLVFKGRICGTTQMLPPPQGFSYIFSSRKERLGDWERTKERKLELVSSEDPPYGNKNNSKRL